MGLSAVSSKQVARQQQQQQQQQQKSSKQQQQQKGSKQQAAAAGGFLSNLLNSIGTGMRDSDLDSGDDATAAFVAAAGKCPLPAQGRHHDSQLIGSLHSCGPADAASCGLQQAVDSQGAFGCLIEVASSSGGRSAAGPAAAAAAAQSACRDGAASLAKQAASRGMQLPAAAAAATGKEHGHHHQQDRVPATASSQKHQQ
ncbi:hypothetical protein COO60DRAFT_589000 [Scenedesmus sp. NREL 46B-D3]|nr:hypothetical protein COO60DRAFT_589000 [Scenedesmus sp. NREL 46B-D3]